MRTLLTLILISGIALAQPKVTKQSILGLSNSIQKFVDANPREVGGESPESKRTRIDATRKKFHAQFDTLIRNTASQLSKQGLEEESKQILRILDHDGGTYLPWENLEQFRATLKIAAQLL